MCASSTTPAKTNGNGGISQSNNSIYGISRGGYGAGFRSCVSLYSTIYHRFAVGKMLVRSRGGRLDKVAHPRRGGVFMLFL